MTISAVVARHRPVASLLSLLLALVVGFGTVIPSAGEARNRTLGRIVGGAIVGTAVYCATHPNACGANGKPVRGVGDAIALDRAQAMLVQSGLAATGFYDGAIDGAIGAGTRTAIASYQAATGDPATGFLTGVQINDLVAVSPDFWPQLNEPVYMIGADIANDLPRAELRELQERLNQLGYGAGAPDGAFGANTRAAIAEYKAEERLPGPPVASRRLLAYMRGETPPEPAGAAFMGMPPEAAEEVAPQAQPAAPQPAAAPVQPSPPPADVHFDLVGVSLGMTPDAAQAAMAKLYGAGAPHETAAAEMFGGNDKLNQATLATKPDWPAPGSEELLAITDKTRPELGVIAAFRLIRMPDGLDKEGFETKVLPRIIKKYGTDAMFGNGAMWIGGGEAQAAARDDANRLLECGDLRLASITPGTDAQSALWSNGGGVTLDKKSLESVTADCGDVLSVLYEGGFVRVGLWNSAALSNAVAVPEIKF